MIVQFRFTFKSSFIRVNVEVIVFTFCYPRRQDNLAQSETLIVITIIIAKERTKLSRLVTIMVVW